MFLNTRLNRVDELLTQGEGFAVELIETAISAWGATKQRYLRA
jgi:hypothetical protein